MVKSYKTNLVHRNTENLGKKMKGKKFNAKKDRTLKYVKCQWEEMMHIKINWQNYSKLKQNAKKH